MGATVSDGQQATTGSKARPLKVPDARTRHVLSQLTYGIPAGLAKEVQSKRDLEVWLNVQLEPDGIEDAAADELATWFPNLTRGPADLWRAQLLGQINVPGWATDFQRWTMLRRLMSKRQLLERMTAFWSDLLYIPAAEGKSFVHRFGYDATIRQHALGRFDDLLVAAETHPAMGCYLDNAASTRTQLNENLGREVLELHTVGREARFSEAEVLDSARILTGYRVRLYDTWEPYYSPADHYVGPVSVLGFSSPNSDPDGRSVTEAYLRHLAHHPATARRVAHRLCVHLVKDVPSEPLVDAVAAAFRESGTDITAMLRALVAHPDFVKAAGSKVRTPVEDMIAMYRQLQWSPHRPQVATDLANMLVWHAAGVGQRPFDWPRPDGPPDASDAWAAVGRVLSSWRIHYSVAVNSASVTGVTGPLWSYWLPKLPADVAFIVDHVSRLLLARPATPDMVTAGAQRMNLEPSYVVEEAGRIQDWRVQQLLGALLDTPAHMFR